MKVREKKKDTYIDHHSLEALLAQRTDSTDRAPIKLDRRTDTVHTRSKDHDTLIVEVDVVLCAVVCKVLDAELAKRENWN
jgi:hypothetical protein